MKQTYYYKGQKIRTSEHDYKYALIVEFEGKIYVKKCSSTYQGCEAELNRLTKLFRNCQAKGINFDDARKYWHDCCMASIERKPFQKDRKFEEVTSGVWSDQLNHPNKYQIVELEAR